MYDIINGLFRDTTDLHRHIADVITQVNVLGAQRDEIDKAYKRTESLHDAYQGDSANAFFVSRDNLNARARYMLGSLAQLSGNLNAWNTNLQTIRDAHYQEICNAMGAVPTELWQYMEWYYSPESLKDVHQANGNEDGGVGRIWEDHVAPFVDVNDSGAAQYDDQTYITMYRHPHSAVSQLVAYVNQLQQQGYDLNGLHDQIWYVDSLIVRFKDAMRNLTNVQLVSAFTLPDICHVDDQPQSPQTPVKPDITPADAQQRAQQIYLHEGNVDGYQVAAALQGCNPADIQLIEAAYKKTYGQDMETDLCTNMSGADLYRAMSILHPECVQKQSFINDTQDGPPHFTLEPPMPAVPTGVSIPLQFWGGTNPKVMPSRIFAIPQSDALANGAPGKLGIMDITNGGFPAPGTYTVVAEIPSKDPNRPQYITYQQVVQAQSDMAPGMLVSLATSGSFMSPSDYKARLQSKLDGGTYNDLNSKLPNDATPIPAVYLAQSGALNQSIMPLALYTKQLSDGTWEIIDATNPKDIRTYKDSSYTSFDKAWHDGFIQNNLLPDGQIAALPPAMGGTSVGGWTTWNKANDDHSTGRNIQTVLGYVSTAFMFVGMLWPPAFIVSGIAGAISGGLQIWDQAQHGDWAWDGDHLMEIANVALNLGFFADGVGSILKMGVTTMADGSVKLTMQGVAKKTLSVGGQVIVQGSVFTMTAIVAKQDAQAFMEVYQRDLAQGKSWDQIMGDLVGTMGDHLLQTASVALPFIASLPSLGRLADELGLVGSKYENLSDVFAKVRSGDLSADDLNQLALKTQLSPDLLKELASSPNLQAALQDCGDPKLFNQMYQHYQDTFRAQIEAGTSDVTFEQYLFSPQTVVKETDVAGLCPYQQTRLDTLLNDPAGLPNPAGLTADEMQGFSVWLRGDPHVQTALAGDMKFDVGALEQEYLKWLKQGGDKSADIAQRDFAHYLSDQNIDVALKNNVDCAQSAAQFDATMAGPDAPKPQVGPGFTTVSDLASSLGLSDDAVLYVQNPDDLINMVQAKGPGARAVVFGSRGAGEVGHYFNIINDNGTVRILDGQTHQAVDLAGFHDFSVLPTADGAARAWDLPEPGVDGAIQSPHLTEVGGEAATAKDLRKMKFTKDGVTFERFDDEQIATIEKAKYTKGDIRALFDQGFTLDDITKMARNVDKGFTAEKIRDVIAELQHPNYRLRTPDQLRDIVRKILNDADYFDPADPAQTWQHHWPAQIALNELDRLQGYEGPKLTGQGYYIDGPNIVWGEIEYPPDIQTRGSLVEMGEGSGGKRDQILRAMQLSPGGKAVVLFAPNYTTTAISDIRVIAENPLYNPNNIDVYVISDRENAVAAQQQYFTLITALDDQRELEAELQIATNDGNNAEIQRLQAELQRNQATLAGFHAMHPAQP